MKKLIFLISILLIVQLANAQNTFQKMYGGASSTARFYYSQQTADGGYIMVGTTDGFGASWTWRIHLIKTDANGDTLWTKTIGGTGDDNAGFVQQTTDGGYIIAGWGDSFGTGGDIYLIKTDTAGNLLWAKTFGGGPFSIYPGSVQQTTDGGYIVTGDFGDSNGYYKVYLIKTDANGDSLWTKIYGGSDDDGGSFVQQTNDGGYIILGTTLSFGAGLVDIYLIKTDANGNLLWSKTYGTAGDDLGFVVKQTTDGGYIITGYNAIIDAFIDYDVYLIKTDSSGNLLWSKMYGGTHDEMGTDVQQTTDGGYIITGYTSSFSTNFHDDAYLIKTDANGNLQWSKTYGGTDDDWANSVQQTTDGGYVITGITRNFGLPNEYSAYLIKTDSLGNSGCNEGNPATVVTTPSMQVTSPATVTGSPPDVINSFSIPTGNGGTVTTLCTSVGINEITTNNSFLLSPNPSTGNFIISFKRTITKGNIEISNTLGENIYTENIFNESKKEINLKNISNGIYFVKVYVYPDSIGNGEKYYCRKIIIE